jgi:hypothetical protein
MSLKLVELQVALPRTQDVGKIQEQLQQRGQHMQDQIVVGLQKQDERKSKQVGKSDKKEKSILHLDHSSSKFVNLSSRKKESTHEQKEQHPFKGNLIDVSG